MLSLRRLLQCAVIATIAAFPACQRADASVPYTITDLGPVSGDSKSSALALNSKGQVVGYSQDVEHYPYWKSIIWTGGVPLVISAVPQSGVQASAYDRATGINDAGQVVGVTEQTTGTYHNHAYSWTQSGGLHDLGTFAGGGNSFATGINSKGAIVGYGDQPTAGGVPHAFLWTSALGFQDLGTFGGQVSAANAINSSGQVVGSADGIGNYSTAFLWTSATGLQSLGTEPGDYGSQANAINDSGVVAGSSGTGAAWHGFRWDLAHGMQDLGTLGGTFTFAYGINNAGQIVGSSMPTGNIGPAHAFIWDSVNGIRDLNNLIAPGTGWDLTQANAINASGQIAGYGAINGVTHGFLLSVPVPIAISLSPAIVPYGTASAGTVTLGTPAVSGPNPFDNGNIDPGVYVQLTSSNTLAAIDGNVAVAPDGKLYAFIGAGQTQATFTINTGQVTTNTSALITATIPGASKAASLTITPLQVQSIVASPATVYNGDSSSITVTLSNPAQQTVNPFDHSILNGALVKLTSSKTAVTFGDGTFVGPDNAVYVYIPYGQSQVSVTVNTTIVPVSTPAQLSATLGSYSKVTNFTVSPTLVKSLTISPASVYNGDSATATLTLNAPAVGGTVPYFGGIFPGVFVKLTSSSPCISYPNDGVVQLFPDGNYYLIVPQGQTTVTFTVNTGVVSSLTSAKLTAELNGSIKLAALSVRPTQVQSFTISPASVYNGDIATATLTLTGPALTATVPYFGGTFLGVFVKISSASPAVTFPNNSTVNFLPDGNTYAIVPQGQTSVTFPINTNGVSANTAASVSAAINGSVKSAALTVKATQVQSITLNPTSVIAGGVTTATVTLNGPALESTLPFFGGSFPGVFVKISSSSPAISIPNNATTNIFPDGNTYALIPQGQTTVTFTVNTNPVAANTAATISAALNGPAKNAQLIVKPIQVQSLTLNPTSVYNGGASTATLTLNGPAVNSAFPPSGDQIDGQFIKLASSSSSVTFGNYPDAGLFSDGYYAYVPRGETSVTFTVSTGTVTATTAANITATLNGAVKTAPLTIRATQVQLVSLTPAAVKGGASSTATITLTGPAVDGIDPTNGQPISGAMIKVSVSNVAATFGPEVQTLSDGNTYVFVPTGQSTATLSINTTSVATRTIAALGTVLNGVSRTGNLIINP